jgi:hypothetical protein
MSTPPPRDERLERIVERVYAVPGVVDVRAWLWEEKLYVAIRAAQQSAPATLLRQVETVAQGLAEDGEIVEVGFLAGE